MHTIMIREAVAPDAAAIARVHVDCWRTTYAGIVPHDYLANLSYGRREQMWRDVLSAQQPATFVYVAEAADGQVVGFASGGPERSGHAVYTGELYAIYNSDNETLIPITGGRLHGMADRPADVDRAYNSRRA